MTAAGAFEVADAWAAEMAASSSARWPSATSLSIEAPVTTFVTLPQTNTLPELRRCPTKEDGSALAAHG